MMSSAFSSFLCPLNTTARKIGKYITKIDIVSRRKEKVYIRVLRTTRLRSPSVTLAHPGSQSREGTVSDETGGGGEGTSDALAEHIAQLGFY